MENLHSQRFLRFPAFSLCDQIRGRRFIPPAQWITSVLSPKIKSTFTMRMVRWPSNQQRGLNVSEHFSIVLKLPWTPREDYWRCCRWLLKLNVWINFNRNGVKMSGVGQQSPKICFQIKLPWSDPTTPILGRITYQLDKKIAQQTRTNEAPCKTKYASHKKNGSQ